MLQFLNQQTCPFLSHLTHSLFSLFFEIHSSPVLFPPIMNKEIMVSWFVMKFLYFVTICNDVKQVIWSIWVEVFFFIYYFLLWFFLLQFAGINQKGLSLQVQNKGTYQIIPITSDVAVVRFAHNVLFWPLCQRFVKYIWTVSYTMRLDGSWTGVSVGYDYLIEER